MTLVAAYLFIGIVVAWLSASHDDLHRPRWMLGILFVMCWPYMMLKR